jgi:hypothetical protein
MDITKYPKKPVYDIASEMPLLLFDCGFENIYFIHDQGEAAYGFALGIAFFVRV